MRLRYINILIISSLLIGLSKIDHQNYYKMFVNQNKTPELILVLGGDIEREHVGVKIAKAMNLPLLISGGSNPEYAEWLIKMSGLKPNQAIFDYRANDTLENFTSIIGELSAKKISNILLVTSEDHLPRAMAIGRIIAGSRGISLIPFPVPCNLQCNEEGLEKIIIDLIRALAWVLTGSDPKALVQIE